MKEFEKNCYLQGWEYQANTGCYTRGDFVLSVNKNRHGEYYNLMLRSESHPGLDCSMSLYALNNVNFHCCECVRNARKIGVELNY